MTTELLERPLTPVHTPEEIAGSLPAGPYTEHYQPQYDDKAEVRDAAHEVQATETVTTPEHVDAVQGHLTRLARGEINDPVAITGRCAEEVNITTEMAGIVEKAQRNMQIVRSVLGSAALHFLREMGQAAKPRSAGTEALADGTVVASYYGDMINGAEKTAQARRPDPTRLVATAVQARDEQQGIIEATGGRANTAHEALSLAYEKAQIYEHPQTGKRYLLSADMPWIGKRTNQLDGHHVQMLAGIENPIGIKIGADSDAGHIRGLQEILNPENIDGKLTLMLRPGYGEGDLDRIVQDIAVNAPNAIIMYDIHGVTKSIDGHKIRAVSDIINDVKNMADACEGAGLTLHGVHLETVMDDERLECVATPDERPTHPGGVDPQLNPAQLEEVLEGVKEHLLRPKRPSPIAV